MMLACPRCGTDCWVVADVLCEDKGCMVFECVDCGHLVHIQL